jgi:hypothetical protein
MKLNTLILALITALLFNSCKNDLEINAPWKETPVVYGFLDVNKTTQYIRVQKTYQNSVDLTTAEGAKISDSLYFKDDMVSVVVSGPAGDIKFTRMTTIPKNSGFFASDVNFIYQANMTINPAQTYTLKVTSKATNTTYTSTTPIVGAATIMSISPNYRLYIRPYQDFNRIQYQFRPGSGGALYDIAIRFWYKEYPTGNPAAFELKYVDYFLEKGWAVDAPTGKTYLLATKDWVYFLKNAIPQAANITREYHQVDYVAIGGSREMKDIIDLSKPSAVIVQRKTDYSNISNGALGIFSSRSETIKADLQMQNDADDNGIDSSRIYLVREIPNFIY